MKPKIIITILFSIILNFSFAQCKQQHIYMCASQGCSIYLKGFNTVLLKDKKTLDNSKKFTFELNKEWYKREQKAAGKFVLITNGNKSPLDVLKTYKELNDVEMSFNIIKNQLDLRPINHYKTQRVKAHVFICILALLIEKIMAKSLNGISPQTALDELKRLKLGSFQIGKIIKNQLTEISCEQKEILNQINIIQPKI